MREMFICALYYIFRRLRDHIPMNFISKVHEIRLNTVDAILRSVNQKYNL